MSKIMTLEIPVYYFEMGGMSKETTKVVVDGWDGLERGGCWALLVCVFAQHCDFFNPHPRTCLLILEAGNGGRGREGDRERNIDQLPFICVPTKDRSSMPQPGQNPQPRHVP